MNQFYEVFTWVAGGLVYLLPAAVILKLMWDDRKDAKEKQNKKAR